jgi:lanthanide-dependent methanol dehydrogenase
MSRKRMGRMFRSSVVWTVLACMPSACSAESGERTRPASTAAVANRSSGAGPDDGEWRTPAKDDANTRFSGLDQITRDNVSLLRPAFAFSTGPMHRRSPGSAARSH